MEAEERHREGGRGGVLAKTYGNRNYKGDVSYTYPQFSVSLQKFVRSGLQTFTRIRYWRALKKQFCDERGAIGRLCCFLSPSTSKYTYVLTLAEYGCSCTVRYT